MKTRVSLKYFVNDCRLISMCNCCTLHANISHNKLKSVIEQLFNFCFNEIDKGFIDIMMYGAIWTSSQQKDSLLPEIVAGRKNKEFKNCDVFHKKSVSLTLIISLTFVAINPCDLSKFGYSWDLVFASFNILHINLFLL